MVAREERGVGGWEAGYGRVVWGLPFGRVAGGLVGGIVGGVPFWRAGGRAPSGRVVVIFVVVAIVIVVVVAVVAVAMEVSHLDEMRYGGGVERVLAVRTYCDLALFMQTVRSTAKQRSTVCPHKTRECSSFVSRAKLCSSCWMVVGRSAAACAGRSHRGS